MPDDETIKALGKVHLYTGEGKGKTTSLIGLAVRASGHQLRTYIGQFLKGRRCGEHDAVSAHLSDYITIERFGDLQFMLLGRQPDETDYEKAQAGLETIRAKMRSGEYHIVMLDEICVAVAFGLILPYQVVELVKGRPKNLEVILSGRWAHPDILAVADLVTEMKPIKHYFDQGVMARKGIEE